MNEDYWTNSRTLTTLGITGVLGSPRGWLRRALDVHNLDDTTFHATSITPHEISVAGIWYRPVERLPVSPYRELIRFYDIPLPDRLLKKTVDTYPVIGIAIAAPMDAVLPWIKIYKDSGAQLTWWKTPENKAARASTSEKPGLKPQRRHLDHIAIFELFDRGLTVLEVSKKLDLPRENIDYVKKKWVAGTQIAVRKPPLSAGAIRGDYIAGLPIAEIVEKYQTTEGYVYRLLGGVKTLKELGNGSSSTHTYM